MCRKYFFKNKGCLSRKFIASGLSAVFSAGMFSSYAGAMDDDDARLFTVVNFEDRNRFLENNNEQENMKPKNVINGQENMNPQIRINEIIHNNKFEKNHKKSKIILAVKIVVVLIVVGLIVVGLSVYFSKRGSSKQPETEQPTNPDNPGTNPDKPEPEPESDNTEDVQDSLGTKLLKGLGTAAVGGTLAGSGAYAFNEVLRNKEAKKVQSKDVNNGEKDGYIYVDSVGNELVEENGNKDNGDDSKKGSRSNEIEEEKLEAEVEDGTESAELEENTKEEDEIQ